ncbi:type II toxin-antitoxin system VapC family toxin [Leifsonia sp. LS-T14]|uniref:type II toxin-antitoxin system VapC family toxin n=1 Tax=unclassified Leifsonia TaxID=2663824 RepID=UPI0035A5D4EB
MLDTSVIVAGLTPEIITGIEDYASSTICRAELVRGREAFEEDPAKQRLVPIRRELIRLLDSIPGFWMDFDARAADGYGRLTAQPKSAMRLKDALIAGHAFAHGLPLVTRDSAFSRFPAVQLEILPTPAR